VSFSPRLGRQKRRKSGTLDFENFKQGARLDLARLRGFNSLQTVG
jgi:hypothetical protein